MKCEKWSKHIQYFNVESKAEEVARFFYLDCFFATILKKVSKKKVFA